jgi:hypothetical protein
VLLLAAEPIIAEAEAALNSLDKGSLGELKSFGSPANEIVDVSSCGWRLLAVDVAGRATPLASGAVTICIGMPANSFEDG